MPWSTRMAELVTVFVATVVGALALSAPVSVAWLRGKGTVQLELLANNIPQASAIGCVVAVVVTVFTSTARSTMVAWSVATLGTILILVNHLMARSLTNTASLTTLNFVDSLGGGVVLGALIAAVAASATLIYTLITALLVGVTIGSAAIGGPEGLSGPASWFVDIPPQWMLWPATLLLAWTTLRRRAGRRIGAGEIELPLAPIVGVVVGVGIPVIVIEWMVRTGVTASGVTIALVTSVVGVMVAGRLLPGRDGMLMQMFLTVGTVGALIVPVPVPTWLVPATFAATVVGLAVGVRWPSPVLGMLSLVAMSAYAAVVFTVELSWRGVLSGGLLALSACTTYCFASALPRRSPSLMLAVTMLFTPGVVIAMRGGTFTTDPDPGRALVDAAPAVAAVAVTLGCLVNVLLLRRRAEPTKEDEPLVSASEESEGVR